MDIFCVAEKHLAVMKKNPNTPIQLTPKGGGRGVYLKNLSLKKHFKTAIKPIYWVFLS